MLLFLFFFFLLRQDLHRKRCQLVSKWDEQKTCGKIKQCMHIRDLSRRISRCPGCNQITQWKCQAYGCKNNSTNNIKQQMNHRSPFGASPCTDSCKDRRDAGTNILSEQYKHRTIKSDQSAGCQGLQDTHRCGGRLDQSCKPCPCQDTDQRIREFCHQVNKCRCIPKRHHGCAHHVHSDEQHTQARDDLSYVLDLWLFQKQDHRNSCKSKDRCHGPYIQSNQLPGNGCPNIGPHNDPDCLIQRHKP